MISTNQSINGYQQTFNIILSTLISDAMIHRCHIIIDQP